MQLNNGLFVADDAIRLACALEARGCTLRAQDGLLHIAPSAALTAEDRAQIMQHRFHLLAIAAYQEAV